MASIRQYAVVHFHIERQVATKSDISALAWGLLSHGITRRLLKQSMVTFYRRQIRPLFTNEDLEVNKDMEFLAARKLSAATYKCRLRVGKEEKPEEDKHAKKRKAKDEDDKENDPSVSELVINIFKVPVDVFRGPAGAFSVTGTKIVDIKGIGKVKGEVHVKWGTDMERLKHLYHEAQVYEYLRINKVNITPEFYGFYEKYAGEDLFAISVFERSSIFPMPKGNDSLLILVKFVKAVQELHKNGIYHGDLLRVNKDGILEPTENIRVSNTGDVLIVNFENSTKHKGRLGDCPSVSLGTELSRGGCRELDDIYEFFKPWLSRQLLPGQEESVNEVFDLFS